MRSISRNLTDPGKRSDSLPVLQNPHNELQEIFAHLPPQEPAFLLYGKATLPSMGQ